MIFFDSLKELSIERAWLVSNSPRGMNVPGVGDLCEGIRSLVASAENEIVMTMPFIQDGGLKYLLPELSAAAARGVSIRVHTQLAHRMQTTFQLLQRLKALELLKIHCPHAEIGYFQTDDMFMHSKLIIVDGSRFYLGSANLCYGGLSYNHEIGLIIESKDTRLKQIADEAWKATKTLSLDGIRQLHNDVLNGTAPYRDIGRTWDRLFDELFESDSLPSLPAKEDLVSDKIFV